MRRSRSGSSGYLSNVLPALDGDAPAVQAAALVWLFVGVNLLGVRIGGRVQVVTTTLKLLPMVFILGPRRVAAADASRRPTRAIPPTTPITLEALMAASTIALFAMLGIESAAVPAGRVRDPGAEHSARDAVRHVPDGRHLHRRVDDGDAAAAAGQLAQSSAPFADLLDQFVGDGHGRVLSVVRRDQRPRRAERMDAARQANSRPRWAATASCQLRSCALNHAGRRARRWC